MVKNTKNKQSMIQNENSSNLSLLSYGCDGGEIIVNESRTYSIMWTIALFVIIMISLFGNTLVMLAVYNFSTLRDASYILLFSLSVTDILSPLSRLLPIGISEIANRWIFGCTWCKISCASGTFFCASSIIHLSFISIERFLYIEHPLKHSNWLTRHVLITTITFMWILSLIMAILPYCVGTIEFIFNKDILACEVYLYKNPSLSLLKLAIYFGVPLSLMIAVYTQVFRVASEQANKIVINSIGNRKIKKRKLMRQYWKAGKTVFVVIGAFFLLWSPYFISCSIKSYIPFILPYWFERLALACAYGNSGCNWIIYCIMNQKMRLSFFKLFRIMNSKLSTAVFQWRNRKVTDVPTVNNNGIELNHNEVIAASFSVKSKKYDNPMKSRRIAWVEPISEKSNSSTKRLSSSQ